jgi:carbon-monoxide dehydrogenase large subunit
MIEIKRYVAVEDCGRVLNPLILEGQIHGGVSMGIGNAYYEKLHFDEQGQLLNASFVDYLIPSATEMPRIEVGHEETRSPLNELGTKGVGEAGAIPVPALFAQAVENALANRQIEILESPLSPNRLYELLHGEGAQ